MRAVVTRVSSAYVTIDGTVSGQIGTGYLVLLGIGPEDTSAQVTIEVEDHYWFVEAPWLEHLLACTNLNDFESRNWLDKQLRESGLFDKMEAMGVQDGDTVIMYDLEFEYQR